MSEKTQQSSAELFKIPHDIVNEQIVLAAALTDDKARALLLPRVRPDMFFSEEHAAIWEAMLDATRRQLQPDSSTLVQLSGGRFEHGYLSDLLALHPTASTNIEHHLSALVWDVARVRGIKGPLSALLDALKDPTTSPERVMSLANAVPTAFQGGGTRKFLRDSTRLAHEHARALRARREGVAVFPFGIEGLDEYGPCDVDEKGNPLAGLPLLVPGAAPGKTTVVTGISGGGKSTITALMALNIARQARKVLYGAWEMGSDETLELLACISTGIQRSRARTGRLSDGEIALLESRMEEIGEYVKFVDMPFGKEQGVRKKHHEVLDVIHSYISDAGCEVAIFDLWRRAFSGMRDESEEAEALYRQQAIAEETKVHCILVQQQRLKDIETRQNPRPTRDGIKGSSAWVDIADTILAPHIPALMKGTQCTTIETLVLKQRYGKWPLCIEHSWDGDLVRLSNGRITAYDPGSEQNLGSKDSTNWLKKK